MKQLPAVYEEADIPSGLIESYKEKCAQAQKLLDFDNERLSKFEAKLQGDLRSIISRITELRNRLDDIRHSMQDDLEAEEYIEEIKSLLDDDFTHVDTSTLDAEEQASDIELLAQCKVLYREIVKRTHPDRTGGDPELTALFIRAKNAIVILDQAELRIIHDLITGNVSKNIIEAYEEKLKSLETERQMLRQTQMWYYLDLSLDEGYSTALAEYRLDLLDLIVSYEHMINRETEI